MRISHVFAHAALGFTLLSSGDFVSNGYAQGKSTPPAQNQTSAPEVVSLDGIVRETFLNRFILEVGGSRLLVEPVGVAGMFNLTPDEKVAVTGRRIGTLVQAARVTRANGEIIHESPSAPSAAMGPSPSEALPDGSRTQTQTRSIPDVLAGLGLQPLGEAVRKRHQTEILARMKDGRSVYVSFDPAGRLWEIEDADYDRDKVKQRSELPEQELFRSARNAGFSPTIIVERKKRHAVVSARDRAGETLELHIDFDGYIYKQVWPR